MISDVRNMDCMEFMKQFPDKFFDLAVVDPPYGINMDGGVIGISRKAKNTQYAVKNWDKQAPEKAYFEELIRVSKNQIIFGANHFISRIAIDSSCWIVWNKENGNNPFADCELAWTSFKTVVRMFTYRWQGMLQGNMKDKEKEVIEMDVTIPKVAIAYKISKAKFKNIENDKIYTSIMNAFDLKVSSTSKFNEDLRNSNLITDSIELLGMDIDSHIIVMVAFETREISKVTELVMEELKSLEVNEEDFERRKKVAISGLVYMTDNIFKINNRIVSDIIKDGKVSYEPIKKIRGFTLTEANNILNKIDLSNKTICIINPIK